MLSARRQECGLAMLKRWSWAKRRRAFETVSVHAGDIGVAQRVPVLQRDTTLERWARANRALLEQSILEAKQALAIDPTCVPALHVLAWAMGMPCSLGGRRIGSVPFRKPCGRPRARLSWIVRTRMATHCARRALSIANNGIATEALADARRAHEMNPNDTTMLLILGYFRSFGR